MSLFKTASSFHSCCLAIWAKCLLPFRPCSSPATVRKIIVAGNLTLFRTALLRTRAHSRLTAVPLPSYTADVTSIARDPFNADRLYVGTQGEGLFIFEGKAAKYELTKKREVAAAGIAGTNR